MVSYVLCWSFTTRFCLNYCPQHLLLNGKTSPWSGSSNHHHPYPIADSHLLGKEANCTPRPSGSTNEPSTNGWNTPIMAATKAAQFWFPRTSEGPVLSNYRPKTYISTAWKVLSEILDAKMKRHMAQYKGIERIWQKYQRSKKKKPHSY